MPAAASALVAVGMYVVYARRRRSANPARIVACPKVELHVHLDGSFDTATLFEAATSKAAQLSPATAAKVAACAGSLDEFAKLVQCGPNDRSLADMIDRFVFFTPFVQGDLELIEELAYKFVAQQAAQNVLYTEVRYSPQLLSDAGAGDGAVCMECTDTPRPAVDAEARAVVEAVTSGLRRGVAEHPAVEIGQVLCFLDARPQWADSLVALATDPTTGAAACPIVGVDIAAGESHFGDRGEAAPGTRRNGAAHRAAMCVCAKFGLGLTNHAGESGPAANVAAAMSSAYGGARRVGHGYRAVEDALSMAREACGGGAPTPRAAVAAFEAVLGVASSGLTFECCPTSSVATGGWAGTGGWVEHPIAQLHRLRLAAEAAGDAQTAAALPKPTISSDDPSVFRKSLSDEYTLVATEMGLGVAALRALTQNAADATFLDEQGRQRLRARLERAWEAWEAAA